MQDPWKYLAFPVAAVAGFAASLVATSGVSAASGLPDFASKLLVIAGTAVITGFMVDEVLPAYIEKVRGSPSGGDFGGDMGGGGGDDFDFDN